MNFLLEFQLKRSFYAIILMFAVLFSGNLYAQKKSAVLKLCAFKDGEPFMLTTTDKTLGESLGFKKHKDSETFIRNMRILINDIPTNSYKPLPKSDNCLTVYRIEQGKRNISIDFKSVSYTNLETENLLSINFKPDLLHAGKVNIVEGHTATVVVKQSSDNISLYQSMDNTKVENCSEGCIVPVGIPIYFMIKSQDEKIKCPVKFELIVESLKEKELTCYNYNIIEKMLLDHVEKNKIMCRANVEYAFFKVFGEGCMISINADKDGLNFALPEIKMLPIDKQKFKYFWKINDNEKKPYNFSGNRKGTEKIPAEGDVIELIEERNF